MVVSKPAKEGGRRFSVVVAACKQSRGIGVSNQLPWRLRGDMQYFKQLTRSTRDPTKQNAVIMGRKTWESIPEKMRPLGDRLNVVISANPAARELYGMGDKVLLATSLGDALQQLCEGDYAASVESVFVIGGSSVYAEAVDLPQLCERVYYTEVSKHAPLRDANGESAPPACAASLPAHPPLARRPPIPAATPAPLRLSRPSALPPSPAPSRALSRALSRPLACAPSADDRTRAQAPPLPPPPPSAPPQRPPPPAASAAATTRSGATRTSRRCRPTRGARRARRRRAMRTAPLPPRAAAGRAEVPPS